MRTRTILGTLTVAVLLGFAGLNTAKAQASAVMTATIVNSGTYTQMKSADGGTTWIVVSGDEGDQVDLPIGTRSTDATSSQARPMLSKTARQTESMIYPNPTAGVTQLNYQLEEAGDVTVRMFDTKGFEALRLSPGTQQTGFKTVTLDASQLPAGSYFYQVVSGSAVVSSGTVVVAR